MKLKYEIIKRDKNNNTSESEPKSAMRSEHLNEGVKPLETCMISRKNLIDSAELLEQRAQMRRAYTYVSYEDPNKLHKEEDMFHFEIQEGKTLHAVTISEVDARNKYSEEYYNCTGVAAVGVDKETGENISLLTHQNPRFFFPNDKYGDIVKSALIERLQKLKERSVSGTVDIVIIGGKHTIELRQEEYENSINALKDIISEVFDFSPVVQSPKFVPQDDTEIYLDTENRRIYMVQPPANYINSNAPFDARDLPNEQEKWRVERW